MDYTIESMKFQVGDRISVDWTLKVENNKFSIDASTKSWRNVTVDFINENIKCLFTKEYPFCAVRLERCKPINKQI